MKAHQYCTLKPSILDPMIGWWENVKKGWHLVAYSSNHTQFLREKKKKKQQLSEEANLNNW